MSATARGSSPPSAADVRAALERLLASEPFANAQRLQRFLGYIVEQTLDGGQESLKGYTIGIEVFGRPADFDPTVDAIVRVEAGRLRSKLREYYDTLGADEMLRIELPKGGYVPRFVAVDRPAIAPRGATDGRTTLLVRPFRNQSGQAEQAYFADGLSEDLIAALSRVRSLILIARHSSFHYKDIDASPTLIASETGADHVLEGSVRRAADRIRVFAQLISTASGAVVWSERYDRELHDVFALQDEVVAAIVDALQMQFAPATAAAPIDLEAYDLVSRGRERFWSYRPAEVTEAQQLFRQAVERAPGYALAHAWYARALALPYTFQWSNDSGQLDVALTHAREAARIDPALPMAHGMIAWIRTWQRVIDEALEAGRRAVEVDGNDADARTWYALALVAGGHGAEASMQIEVARRHDPHVPAIGILAEGLALWLMQDLEAAAACFSRGVNRAPDFLAFYLHEAATAAELGDRAAAVAALAELERRHPGGLGDFANWSVFVDAEANARLGRARTLAYRWFGEERATGEATAGAAEVRGKRAGTRRTPAAARPSKGET